MNNPFAPVEGQYALLRNGVVMGAYKQNSQGFWVGVASDINIFWKPDGTAYGSDNHGNRRLKPDHDIIATISPEAMALAIHPDMDGAVKAIESLVKLADAACDYADSHCRAFPIATAPKEGVFLAWDNFGGEWEILAAGNEGFYHPERFTHWAPLPPPPSNPPLPAVFTDLGAALEKIKGAG